MSVAERIGQLNGRVHSEDFPGKRGQIPKKPYEYKKVLPGSPEYEANTRYIESQIAMMKEWDRRNPLSSQRRRVHPLEND